MNKKRLKWNKQGGMKELIKILFWVFFIIIAIGGVIFLIRFLTNQG